jgi:ribosome biogenesis protein YTM1
MLDLPKSTPFDFLINGTFLRTTLAEYLQSAGLSSEVTLTLQYVRSTIPPTFKTAFEHDDWVSSLDILSSTSPVALWSPKTEISSPRIASGSYDGLLRIWSPSGTVIATSPAASAGGHIAGIKATKFLSPSTLVTSSLDRSIRVWKYAEESDGFAGKLTPALELYGHTASIDSLAVHGPSQRILSASADHTIGLWTPSKTSAPEADSTLLPSSIPAAKRRKLTTSTNTAQRGPLSLLDAHTAPATGVIFHPSDATVAYSVSLDHTLKTLDLSTSTVVDTRTTAHPLLSLCALPTPGGGNGHILAVGTAARHIALLDPRVDVAKTAVMTLRGHRNKVVSLAADPHSSWGLVSGSHDGTARVWDLRNTREGTREEGGGRVGEAVFVLGRESGEGAGEKVGSKVGGEGEKVFGVCWDGEVGIVSAGEDRRVQINRGDGVTKRE